MSVSNLNTEHSVALFGAMLRIRLIEEAVAERYAEQEMRCPVHLSIGQEATAVGVCAELRTDDQIVSTHRCHAHYLAKGGDFTRMMAEIYGKATGCCGGRGGSMHLFDAEVGMLASLPIVGGSIPIATGAALAFQQEGGDRVAVGFLGDAAVEEGVFHESVNFAVVARLPVIYVIENNLYACYTHLAQRQPARPLSEIGLSHGLAGVHADGNDLVAVRQATRQAVAKARSGGGPSLLVLDTYRWREHCGPGYDNNIGYRGEAEFEEWKARCPVAAARSVLEADGRLSPALLAEMIAEIKAEIATVFAAAKQAPLPGADSGEDHIYA